MIHRKLCPLPVLIVGALLLAVGACSDPAPGSDADVATQPETTDATTDDAAADATNDAAADVQSITRNPKCGKFDDAVNGKKVPWQGLTIQSKLFTCNSCRGGYPNIIGKWRLVDGNSEDPRTPLKSTDGTPYAEYLEFDGNTWKNTIMGTDLGKEVTATIDGWYFCSDKVELAGAPAVFVQDTVKPEGAFGNKSGSTWRADILTSGKDRLLLNDVGFGPINKAGADDFVYCRIGAMVDVEGTPVLCNDPVK